MKPLEIRASDPIIKKLAFKPYRYKTKRQAEQFLPSADQPQIIRVTTRWGGVLTGKCGDFLVSELDDPEEQWVVEEEIFLASYQEVEIGVFVKTATVDLTPLTNVTRDPDQDVIVYSLEGPLRVRSGDFYLAVGINHEIWPVPIAHIKSNLEPVE